MEGDILEYVKALYKNIENFDGKEITLAGWIRTIRNSKTFGFIELNDGTFFKNVQIVFDNTLNNYGKITKLGVGSSIRVRGIMIKTPENKQPFEIQSKEIKVEGTSPSGYPLQKKRHSLEYLRTIAHLRPRTNTFSAVFRVRSLAAFAIHKFFNERNFVCVHTPIITTSDCEGAGEMFQVTTLNINIPPRDEFGNIDYGKDFFGKRTSLTVSGQLSAETYALALRNVYTFGPTFRAENSNTPRHAAEFWMIEPEIAFAELEEDMELAEEMLKYTIRYVLENAPEEMEFFNKYIDKNLLTRLNGVINADFAKTTYTEAINILKKSDRKFEYPVEWGLDLQTEHERYLTEEHFKKPVFVTDYPKDIKAFYMRLNDDRQTVAAMDLLVPGVGEIIGGSQREERLETLRARMAELELNEDDYNWYLDLRKYGGAKHSGFGLGFERLVMYITGVSNIRDSIPYPRTAKSAEF